MRVLEGPISPMVCATEGETEIACERQTFCSANLVWERVRDSVAQALDSLTLADLVPPRISQITLHKNDAIAVQTVAPAISDGRKATRV